MDVSTSRRQREVSRNKREKWKRVLGRDLTSSTLICMRSGLGTSDPSSRAKLALDGFPEEKSTSLLLPHWRWGATKWLGHPSHRE